MLEEERSLEEIEEHEPEEVQEPANIEEPVSEGESTLPPEVAQAVQEAGDERHGHEG